MRPTETATKTRNDKISRLLASLGVRTIGRDVAETPERTDLPYSNDKRRDHGSNDR